MCVSENGRPGRRIVRAYPNTGRGAIILGEGGYDRPTRPRNVVRWSGVDEKCSRPSSISSYRVVGRACARDGQTDGRTDGDGEKKEREMTRSQKNLNNSLCVCCTDDSPVGRLRRPRPLYYMYTRPTFRYCSAAAAVSTLFQYSLSL